MLRLAEDALLDDFRKKIKSEIQEELTEEEKARQIAEIDKAIKSHSTKQALQEIKGFIFEGIFLAAIIGLIVNQMTDIVTYLKGEGEQYMYTVVIIFALVALVFFYIMGRFVNTIERFLLAVRNVW